MNYIALQAVIRNEKVLGEEWEVHYIGLDGDVDVHLFDIRKSTLDGGGWGLFAAHPYNAGDLIGCFHGHRKERNDGNGHSPYAMLVDDRRGILVDPIGGVAKTVRDKVPTYFGLHMANDLFWNGSKPINSNRRTRTATLENPRMNIFIQHKTMWAFANQRIVPGEELFLDYGGSDE